MIAFILTMPNCASWNGRWSLEDELHCIVKTNRTVTKEVIGREFYYNFGDGWTACVEVKEIPAKQANQYRQKSRGFCGYDWMVDSIIKHRKIRRRTEI
jgi:phenolic acid decarboxylase